MTGEIVQPYPLDLEMFREQRQRLGVSLTGHGAKDAIALVASGKEVNRNFSDTTYPFRQDTYFFFLFGSELQESLGGVLPNGEGVLFVPKLPEDYAMWMGPLPTTESVKNDTGVEHVYYLEDIVKALTDLGVKTVHVMDGKNTDSGLNVTTATFEGQDKFTVDKSFLFEALSNLRTIKTEKEIKLLAWLNAHASMGHVVTMKHCKPGLSERHLEATFCHHMAYHAGCRNLAYGAIVGAGNRGAVLHYPDNNRRIEDGMMAVLDLGGEYANYASDITTSYPINGKYTPDQRWFYQAVLDAHNAVLNSVKPGVAWQDMQKLALRTMSKAMIENGLLRGTVEEIEAAEVMASFMPHGLGHMIGLEVHDVGGYPAGGIPRSTSKSLCRLRTARILEAGHFITVEPGMYFIEPILKKSFADPAIGHFFNKELIESKYMNFGGVRLEDDIIITKDGCYDLTSVPREIDDVEAVMAGKKEWVIDQKTLHN